MQRQLKDLALRILSQQGISVSRCPPALCKAPQSILHFTFDHALCQLIVTTQRKLSFVQVGAFDGVSGDPIYKYVKQGLLTGCLIEPQSDAFSQLESNYSGIPSIQLKRAAISSSDGSANLFRVRPGTQGPPWLFQLASFRRDVLLKHAPYIRGLEDAIITERVPTITFHSLFQELQFTPDVLIIDTEGFDFEIIKLYNIRERPPRIILYEHKHLSSADQEQCIILLLNLGYKIACLAEETVASRPTDKGLI
jgi:FkbM family methyltransferase